MKTKILALILCALMLLSFVSCGNTAENNTENPSTTDAVTTEADSTTDEETEPEVTGIWADATHTEDKEFGEGEKTIEVEVIADEISVTFTIHTDGETLGDALIENSLVEGEEGEFGLYIKKVNGMLADYDVDKTYWGLSKYGEYLMTGADSTPIADGEHYELTRTK